MIRVYTPANEASPELLSQAANVPSLKGLFPFKGKGRIALLGVQAEESREGLLVLGRHIVRQSEELNYVWQLGAILRLQRAGSGASFLRWRLPDHQAGVSGVPLWESVMQKQIDVSVRQSLLAMEQDRVAFNLQMSICSTLIRQSADGLTKMESAEKVWSEERV
ncbi:DUF3158 family protein [Pokkaliibacter plantistimulans]|uniref:DUF3158 family protein n=1 Tax=Pokkaliibacter plantistimulans TaxID=1635171 RepID=UPI000D74E116|nr:DUF3158 family protein [Pokkaliibacter plantistimulans]